MNEQLISFETAKLAKAKGFNWPVEKGWFNYSGNIITLWILADMKEEYIGPCTTQSLLAKWLRDVHGIQIEVLAEHKDRGYRYDVSVFRLNEEGFYESLFNTYEEALEAGLLEALKLL